MEKGPTKHDYKKIKDYKINHKIKDYKLNNRIYLNFYTAPKIYNKNPLHRGKKTLQKTKNKTRDREGKVIPL